MSGCERFQEMISQMIDGELRPEDEALLAEHLKGCKECAAMYAAFSALSSALSEDLEEPPESLRENVMAQLRRQELIKKNRRRLPRPVGSLLATAACIALLIGASYAAAPFLEKSADSAVRASGAAALAEGQAADAGFGREAVITVEARPETEAEAPAPDTEGSPAASRAAEAPQGAETAQLAPPPAPAQQPVADGYAAPAEDPQPEEDAQAAESSLSAGGEEDPAAEGTVLIASYVELWDEEKQAELDALLNGRIMKTALADLPMLMTLPGLEGPSMDVPEADLEETEEAAEEPLELSPEELAECLLYVLSLDEEGQRQLQIYLFEGQIYFMDTAEQILQPARCTAEELEELLA